MRAFSDIENPIEFAKNYVIEANGSLTEEDQRNICRLVCDEYCKKFEEFYELGQIISDIHENRKKGKISEARLGLDSIDGFVNKKYSEMNRLENDIERIISSASGSEVSICLSKLMDRHYGKMDWIKTVIGWFYYITDYEQAGAYFNYIKDIEKGRTVTLKIDLDGE